MARLTYDELIAMDIVQQKWPDVTAHVVDAFADYVARELRHRMSCNPMGSPIEALFWMWWKAMEWARNVPSSGIWLLPQEEVILSTAKYRVDFSVQPDDDYAKRVNDAGGSVPKIAVELDGHQWHERTREQVAHRNMRDRDLQAAGWIVFHYSGSELVRDPFETVSDCHYKAGGAFYDYERRLNGY